jgi:signal transduction histidine kinase
MDELKNEFLYTVTHELRTPLTSIRALSEIVYDNPDLDDEQKQDYLDIIIKETEKLSHLITQVLNLEKYESGKQKIYPSSFDIKQLSKDVIKSLTGLSEERKLNINFICQDSSMIIHADKDLINQVIYNLVSNAIKFAETTIDIYILPSIDDIEIKIKDDGPGINESTKDLLFDKFYQSKQSHLQKPVGSGLGLAICKKIIELHHGKISVENNQGKGASFTFALPIIH